MKTIVFKEPVEKKLKELKIKTKLVRNIYLDGKLKGNSVSETTEKIKCLTDSPSIHDVLMGAFTWNASPEESEYWVDVYRKAVKK